MVPNYEKYIYSLIIYLIFIIFTNSTSIVHSLFLALGYVKYTIPILIFVNSMYILFLTPIIKLHQLNGVIIALMIQSILVVVFKLIIMKKYNKLKQCSEMS